MAKYNCIIKELPVDGQGQAKVLGRIFLQDLSQIPNGWVVKFRVPMFDRNTTLQRIMCTSKNPLVIYKPSGVSPSTDSVKRYDYLPIIDGVIKGRIEIGHGITHAARSGIKSRDVQYKILATLDFDAGPTSGVGVATSTYWKSYKHGMNLVGQCHNMECDSRRQTETDSKLFYQDGYGEIYLPDDANKFSCPACDSPTFRISNFVLSCGRALFVYQKCGIGSERKEAILESDWPLEEFKTFDTLMPTDQPLIDYDFVSIKTVHINQSFYFCMACDEYIGEVEDEKMLSCGHTYHNKPTCCPDSTVGCTFCEALPLELNELLLTVG